MITFLLLLLIHVFVQAMEGSASTARLKVLQEKYGDRPLNAIFVTPGSTGDVLPILAFALDMTKQLPWLKVTKFMTFKPAKVDQIVNRHGIATCPLMEDLWTDKYWQYSNRKTFDGNYDDDEFNYSQIQNVLIQLESLSKSQSIDRNMDDSVDVIFYWSIDQGCILNGLFGKRTKSLADRLLIKIEPTYFSRLNFDDGLGSLLENEHLSPAWYTKPSLHFNTKELHIKHRERLNFGGHISHYLLRQQLEADLLQKDVPTIVLMSKVFFTQEELGTLNHIKFVGTYQLQDKQQEAVVSSKLLSFLEGARSKTVFIGFGSNSPTVDKDFNQKICDAVLLLDGLKVVWQINSNGQIVQVPEGCRNRDGIYILNDYIPHSFIFPLVSTVVHHGGSGTTHAALLYGASQVIIPLLPNDQLYFAVMVFHLKIGSGFSDIDFSTEDLATAINSCTKGNFVEEVRRLQHLMLAEQQENQAQLVVANIVYEASLTKDLKRHKIIRRQDTFPCLTFGSQFYLRSRTGYCNFASNDFRCNHNEPVTKFSFQRLGHLDLMKELPAGGQALLTYKLNGKQVILSISDDGNIQADSLQDQDSCSINFASWHCNRYKALASMVIPASPEFKSKYDHCIRQNEAVFVTQPYVQESFFGVDHQGRFVKAEELNQDSQFTLQFAK